MNALMANLPGSSPLTRGKPKPAEKKIESGRLIPAHAGKTATVGRGAQLGGLIPAHAGKTPPRPRRSSRQRAHPRSRGENATHPDEVMNALGSSPLTRGKLRRTRGLRS